MCLKLRIFLSVICKMRLTRSLRHVPRLQAGRLAVLTAPSRLFSTAPTITIEQVGSANFKVRKSISCLQVKALRDLTGAGISDCKQALNKCAAELQSGENLQEKAAEFLRKKGVASAAKKSGSEKLSSTSILNVIM